jgi:predicted TPR repeat methyltransferase
MRIAPGYAISGPDIRSNMPAQPLFVSSGDLLADRRYGWALDYLRKGDPAAAADILEQVVDAAPGFATAWFALATIRERAGDRQGAVAAFQAASAADREDYHGARLHLARLGAGEDTPAMSATYVRRLFDQHAPEFEASLLGRLEYRAPLILLEALRAVVGEPFGFGSVLDLGCGTGLAGAAIRPFCKRLVGVDVSTGMIEQAGRKGIYDRLAAMELSEYLATDDGRHDLVLAADVLVYVGDLNPITAAVARALTPGGAFAFTVETHDGPGVLLQPTLRYAHGATHVKAALDAAGLRPSHLAPAATRKENGEWVRGLVVVAMAPPTSSA